MKIEDIRNKLVDKELKITPQRIAVLEAITELNNHPTAENVIEYIRVNYPNVSVATVYKVLDAFVACGLVKRVKTELGAMRYDAITESHHHIYCSDSDCIEDYFDDELNSILLDYFQKKSIPNFKIEDLKLQIIGKFSGETD